MDKTVCCAAGDPRVGREARGVTILAILIGPIVIAASFVAGHFFGWQRSQQRIDELTYLNDDLEQTQSSRVERLEQSESLIEELRQLARSQQASIRSQGEQIEALQTLVERVHNISEPPKRSVKPYTAFPNVG
jgi:uncharacterized protein HemX